MHGSDEFVQALSTEEWEKEQKMFLKHVPSVNSRRRYVINNAYTMDRIGVWCVSDIRRCSRMRVHAKLIFTFQWSNGRSSCTVWTYTSLARGVMIVDITLSPASPVLAVQRSRCCEMFFISIRSSVMLIISPIHSSPNRVPRRSTQTLIILQRKTCVQPQHHHHLDPLHARCFKHS